MLKFAPKNHKQTLIAVSKERKIFVYKIILPFIGRKTKNIPSPVWKYFINSHRYYKAFSSLSRSRKACLLTGRSRSIYRAFQLSRIKIRETAGLGLFLGVSKASW